MCVTFVTLECCPCACVAFATSSVCRSVCVALVARAGRRCTYTVVLWFISEHIDHFHFATLSGSGTCTCKSTCKQPGYSPSSQPWAGT